jgi:lysine 2,3-aminomutase
MEHPLSEEPPSDSQPRDWYDWRWQIKNLVRTPEEMCRHLSSLRDKIEIIRAINKRYPLLISPYYLSLINDDDPDDPLLRQVIPYLEELSDGDGDEDPLAEERDMPVPGLTHRYPDRVLLVLTNFCSTFCRFCTRKRLIGKRGFGLLGRLDEVFSYLKNHVEVRDVILSGGDPLTLSLPVLGRILDGLVEIPHIEMVRIGSRVPVTLPMRLFDRDLLDLLGRYNFLWVNTHFNHPREVTPEATTAVENLQRLGIPVNNQTVLLKGVNDSLSTMKSLVHALLRIRVRPYYIFHCDPVKGTSHFRTDIKKGIEIIEGLRGFTSGLGVPTYVVDGPGGSGKIPVSPNYVLSLSEDSVTLRNYENHVVSYRYQNMDEDYYEDRHNL